MTRWMKYEDLTAGSYVETDSGFTCMSAGKKLVHKDEAGFYLVCEDGKHYLDGQVENDVMIGITQFQSTYT